MKEWNTKSPVIALTIMKTISVGAESQSWQESSEFGQSDSKYCSRLGAPRNSMAAKFGASRTTRTIKC